jgi:hypothetical protein
MAGGVDDENGAVGNNTRGHRNASSCTRALIMKREKPPKPKSKPSPRRLPNREAIMSKMAPAGDSGRILEEDRS